jgi:hypothetical protein
MVRSSKKATERTVWFLAKIGEDISYEGEMTVMANDDDHAKRKVRKKLQDECGATLVFHDRAQVEPKFVTADHVGFRALAHA